jgi:glycosyltransferase involved in cell wall biosynthesis
LRKSLALVRGQALKVVHVVARFHLGGSEQVAAQLCKGLVRRGHSCTLVAVTMPPMFDPVGEALKADFVHSGIEFHELAGSNYRETGFTGAVSLALTAAVSLARLVAKRRPDIVHSHTDRPDFAVSLASRMVRLNVARTIHNSSLWPTHPVAGYVAESGFKNELVVSISRASYAAYKGLRRRFLLPESPYQHFIMNGVELPVGEKKTDRSDLLKLGADMGRVQLCFAGRLTYQKGFDVLVAATELLEPSIRDQIEVHAFGFGEDKDMLVGRVRRSQLPIHFHDPVPRINRLFPAFDAVVMPSRWEGLPLVALESLAAGVPVIGTSAPGLDEVLPRNWPFIAAPGDPSGFAAQILAFLRSRHSCGSVVREATQRVRERHDPEQMVEAYLAAYIEFLDRPRRAG